MPLTCEKKEKKEKKEKEKKKKGMNKSVGMVSEHDVLLIISTHSLKPILGFVRKFFNVMWYGDVCF